MNKKSVEKVHCSVAVMLRDMQNQLTEIPRSRSFSDSLKGHLVRIVRRISSLKLLGLVRFWHCFFMSTKDL